MTFSEYMSKIAQMYKLLSNEGKQQYLDSSLKDKERFDEEMKEFKKSKKLQIIYEGSC